MKMYGRLARSSGGQTRAQGALRKSVRPRGRSALHTLVIDSLAEQIAIIDQDARIVDVNAAWRRFVRESRIEPDLLAIGGSYLDLLEATATMAGRQGAEAARGVLKVLGGRQASLRIEYPMRAGEHDRWCVMRVTRLQNTRRPLYVSLHFDITERRHAEEEALHLSRHDSLTGLANRRHFEEVLANEVRRGVRRRTPVSLIEVDVDFFKEFNDWHGHVAGDECLVKVAEVLAGCARRPGDLAARLGGDEFALILGDTASDAAERVAEGIRESVVALGMLHGGTDAPVTVSVGAATLRSQGLRCERSLFAAADRALYRAKSAGRNRVEHECVEDDIGPDPGSGPTAG